jgi:hypothetical protein
MNLRENYLVYIMLCFGFIGFSQENPVKTNVDTTFIRIGEQFQYKLSVKKAPNIIFPKLKLDSLHKVEVLQSLPVDTLENKLEKKYLLTSFDSGQYVIPRQQLLINNKKYLSDSLLIHVATVKVDTTKQKMFPIKAVKSEPKILEDYLHLWWLIFPLLAIIGLILYFILRKKSKKEVVKVSIPPIQEALNRLKDLDEKQLLQQQKIKLYYTELADIVRTYIEKDIKIPALESTTNELLETIKDFNESSKLGISKETIKALNQVLQNADLAKFAKHKPIIEQVKSDRILSEQILQNFKPIKNTENELE